MVTTTTRTVGGTGDYSTWALWEAACPANLVTADQIWEGQGQNEEFYVSGGVVTISGQTTDATRFVRMTAAAGASFADNAGKLTNELRYNASNGCALRSGNFASTVFVGYAYTQIKRLQIQATIYDTAVPATGASVTIDECILQGGGRVISLEGGGTNTTRNTLFIRSANGGGHGIFFAYSTAYVYNCAVIRPSNLTPGDNGIRNEGGTLTVKNTSVFGFSTFETGGTAASNNNATDLASGAGTSSQHSLTFTDQFEQSSAATALDLRTKSGSAQIGNGADLSGSGVTVDIVGTARAAPFDIGVWQTASSANEGTAAVTLGALTGAGVGTLAITATGAATLGAATASSSATLAITASGAATLGAVTASGVGTLAISATGAAALGAATAAGVGTLAITGAGAATLGAVTAASAGTLAITGSGAATLGVLTLAASSDDEVTGTGAATLGALTLAAVGVLPITGTAALTLGDLAGAGVGTLGITAAGAATLGAVAGAGVATLAITGAGAVTLGTLLAAGGDAILVPITTPASRRYTIPAMPRRGTVPSAPRSYALPAAARRYTVQPEG